MGRPPKLSKWGTENALSRWRTVSETARQLGLDRRTLQRSMKRYGVDKHAVLAPFVAPEMSASHPAPERDPSTPAEPPSEDAILKLQSALELPREVILHAMSTKHEDAPDCPMCRQIALAWHRVYGCPDGDCGLQHKLNPASVGLAPKKPELWRSYAPRSRPWER